MAPALSVWATNPIGKKSVRNLQFGPRTRLTRGMEHYTPLTYR